MISQKLTNFRTGLSKLQVSKNQMENSIVN